VSGSGVGGDAPQFNGNFTVAGFVPRELIKTLGQSVPETADSRVLDSASPDVMYYLAG
jgi:hypothetical protein